MTNPWLHENLPTIIALEAIERVQRMTDEEKTLEWCNHQRMLRGMTPLEAMPVNEDKPMARRAGDRAYTCPVAQALIMRVTRQYYGRHYVYVYHPTGATYPQMKLPDFVANTIEAYDRELGLLPAGMQMVEGNGAHD